MSLDDKGQVVIFNGRVIGPFDDNEEFTSEDIALLERYSQSTYGDKLFKYLLKSQDIDDSDYGNYISNTFRNLASFLIEKFQNNVLILFVEKSNISDDMIMKIASLLVPRPQTRSRFDVPFHGDEYRYNNEKKNFIIYLGFVANNVLNIPVLSKFLHQIQILWRSV